MGMRRSRVFQLAVLVVVLIFAGAKGYRYVQLRAMSPFVLWEFRAGSSFTALEKSAFRQTKQRFACNDVVRDVRFCEMRVTGIVGLVRVLVDSKDRVAAIQFLPDSASPAMREEARRVAAEWNLVRAGATDAPKPGDGGTRVTRWRSADGKWGAVMRYAAEANAPRFLHLSDATALAEIASSTPLASLALAFNQLVESDDVGPLYDVDEVLRTTMYGRATDRANETASPTAPSLTLPPCEPERIDPIMLARPGAPDESASPTTVLLERAIPVVYPGSRLAVGDGMWIVDSTGRSERVHVGQGDGADPSAGVLYSIQFPGRVTVAMQRLEDGVPDRHCRAGAELIFARANDDGSLAQAHRVPVDQEALVSEISRISLFEHATTGDEPQARVRYTAGYAGKDWTGSVEWEAIVVGDPPRPVARVPLMFEHRAQGAEEPASGYIVLTGRPAGGIELSTLEQHRWGFATRTFVVPLDATGALLGARIHDRPF